jgi:hypothetical protein
MGRWRNEKANFSIKIGKEFKKDLKWWNAFLPKWNGKQKMMNIGEPELSPTVSLFSDASNAAGAGVLGDEFFQIVWDNEVAEMSATKQSINVREMYALVSCAMTWGHRWRDQVVQFNCDNMSDVLAVKKLKSKNVEIMHLMRVLHLTAAHYGFVYTVKHVKGVDNPEADLASRETNSEKVKETNSKLKISVQPQLPPLSNDENWEETVMAKLLLR